MSAGSRPRSSSVPRFGIFEAALVLRTRRTARIVARRRTRVPRRQAHVARRVARRWVERVLAGRHDDERIHLEPEVDVCARARVTAVIMQLAVVADRDLAE